MDAYAVQIIRDNKWIILGTLLSGLLLVKRYYNTVYAKVLYLINLKLSKSKTLMGAKAKLFSQIPAPQDKGMTNSEDLLIVEIGAGTGANFTFFPDGSVVKCVEPKTEFESYVTDERKKNGEHLKSVEFVQGYGESLSKNFEPSSVDFVVTTLVLCSVQDVEKVAQEARKILKPVSYERKCFDIPEFLMPSLPSKPSIQELPQVSMHPMLLAAS